MPSQGPVSPTGTPTNDTAVGVIAWTNPGNAQTLDDVYAQASGGDAQDTNYLESLNYSAGLASIPDSATIDGIEVAIHRKASIATGINNYVDLVVQLVVAGVVSGANKADTITKWPTVEAVATYGGPTDTWTIGGLTGASVKATNFGVVLTAIQTGGANSSVDGFQITVYYTAPTPPSSLSGGWSTKKGLFDPLAVA